MIPLQKNGDYATILFLKVIILIKFSTIFYSVRCAMLYPYLARVEYI